LTIYGRFFGFPKKFPTDDFSGTKIREQKIENTSFSFGDEINGDVKVRDGYNGHFGSVRDIPFKKVRNVRGRNIRGCIILVPYDFCNQ
jgi:hypothetical protein